jgi:hypothetical protein
MAEGRTDRGIREALWLSQKTVEAHARSIFRQVRSTGHALRQPSRPRGSHLLAALLTRNKNLRPEHKTISPFATRVNPLPRDGIGPRAAPAWPAAP